MKKFLLFVAVAFAMASCSTTKQTATYRNVDVANPFTTPVVADLEVSSTKIRYEYEPSKVVARAGKDNVLNMAISRALYQNGNADVLVSLETMVKYNSSGKVTSVIITGYPAKYKNFRTATAAEMMYAGKCVPVQAEKPAKRFKFRNK